VSLKIISGPWTRLFREMRDTRNRAGWLPLLGIPQGCRWSLAV